MTDRVCELFCGAGGMGLGFSRHFHVTDARQLDDAHSRQTVLEVWA